MSPAAFDADVVVIGSGFGGTMTALTVAHKLHPPALRAAQAELRRLLGLDPKADKSETRDQRRLVEQLTQQLLASGELKRIVILERGSWWTTPVPTLQDPQIKTPDFLRARKQRVQYWSSLEHFKGLIDLFTRCLRRPRNEDGLYDMSRMGRRGFLGLFGNQNDGVSVLRASGVGGGSLVYSNITVRPPEFIFDGAWDMKWNKADRDRYYELAKHAIGYGIPLAWDEDTAGNIPYQRAPTVTGATNAGLSNIATQSARLDPHWHTEADPFIPANSPRSVKSLGDDGTNWLPRARAFQTAMRAVRPGGFHTVDSSINDLSPERAPSKPPPPPPPDPPPYDPLIPHNHPPGPPFGKLVNYCERQGRCTLGCLPGARHTLNKQLIGAAYGKATDPVPVPAFPNLEIRALVEVNLIKQSGNGYVVEYYGTEDRSRKEPTAISARRVIVAAGCLGTNELLLRCKDEKSLPGLSERLGEGFCTNGDFLAFLDQTKEPVNLSRGPVQTSVAHFNDRAGEDLAQFHIVEDQGIPRALASTVNFGLPLIQSLTYQKRFWIWWALFRAILRRVRKIIGQILANANAPDRRDFFESEEELTMRKMCITASGRAQANGKFTLGQTRRGESALRVKPMEPDKTPFHKDPIFGAILATLNGPGGLAEQLRPLGSDVIFKNPFLSETFQTLEADAITTTHPLGGCRIGSDAGRGVVDELGRVFDANTPGRYYDGLYIADASIIPAAVGVNPSLTISALALRIGENIAAEMRASP